MGDDGCDGPVDNFVTYVTYLFGLDMCPAVCGHVHRMFRHVRGEIAVAGAISYLTARTRPSESDSGTVA